jgi:hypothetical protein
VSEHPSRQYRGVAQEVDPAYVSLRVDSSCSPRTGGPLWIPSVRQSRPAASDIGTNSKIARLNSLEMAGRAVLGENPDSTSERAPTVSIF